MDPMEEDLPTGASESASASSSSLNIKPLPPQLATTGPPLGSSAPGIQNTSSSSPAEAAARPRPEVHAISKRRRGAGIVTPTACTECRKKRAKCDGQKPCSRCKNLGVPECTYEVPVRQSKEYLREEIETLKRQQRSSDRVLAALSRPDLWEEVLARLRSGQTVDGISNWLGGVLPPHGGGGTFVVPVSINPSAPASHSSSSGNPPIATYATGAGSYGPIGVGPSTTVSPVPSHQPQHSRHDPDTQSPWSGLFSPHSQPMSAAGGGSHAELMNWAVGTGNRQRVGIWLEDEGGGEEQRFTGMEKVLMPETPEMKVPAGAWTKITDNSRLIQHLLALYFCWEYPTFASLSKEHFLKDFQDGRTRYCSSILVNALLALGCRFSKHPTTRANPDDPYTSGDHFFKESLRLFHEEEDHYRMTTIQALGIMSIREASCGRDSESWYYAGQSIRLTLEMGLQQNTGNDRDEDETAVRAATFWGAYSLDLAWSLATGSLPQCSFSPHLPPKPGIIDDIEASLWIPYTDNGTPLKRSCEQPSNVRSVYTCFCELSELVHRSLYILHSPGKPVNSRQLQKIYTEYLSWYDQIPDVLRLGHNFTPAVLFAHMYYHFAILLLFRPFIKLRIIDSSLLPRVICMQAADAIQGLSRSYSQLYTLRRTPSFVPYFVLTSAIMHLTIGASQYPAPAPSPQAPGDTEAATAGQPTRDSQSTPQVDPGIAAAISRGIADLTEMAPCHHFAEQALNILLYLAKKWNLDIQVQEDITEDGDSAPDSSPRPAAQISNRGIRPSTHTLNFFVPDVTEDDVMCTWGPVTSRTTSRSHLTGPIQEKGRVAILDEPGNPLFWPFPMQGRPLIPTGDKLREAGFELLHDYDYSSSLNAG